MPAEGDFFPGGGGADETLIPDLDFNEEESNSEDKLNGWHSCIWSASGI